MSTYYAVWYSGCEPAVFRAQINLDEAMRFEMFDARQGAWVATPFAAVQNWIDWVLLDELPQEVQDYERGNVSLRLGD